MKYQLKNFSDFSDFCRSIGKDIDQINVYLSSANQISFYDILDIPKRGKKRRGEFRTVYSASEHWLSDLHVWVARIIQTSVSFGNHVQGFLPGRSIFTNAKQHLGAKVLLHIDLRNFFDLISYSQVRAALLKAGARPKIAEPIARACTIDGFLMQGTRCAPTIANLVAQDLDEEMLVLAEKYKATYTRYADNLTFSGDRVPTIDEVKILAEGLSFTIREDACFYQRRGGAQFVTGLHIADKTQPRLSRRVKRRIRLIAHYIKMNGWEEHFAKTANCHYLSSSSKFDGMLKFAYGIEPEFALKVWAKLPPYPRNYDEYDDIYYD
jgi:RNA-directed DNA polymerase